MQAPRRGTVPADIVFRSLGPGDAEPLCDLILAARGVDGPHEPVSREDIRHLWFDRPGVNHETDVVVAVEGGGSLVGVTAAISREAATRAARVFVLGTVRPDRRRQGIGRHLFRQAEARARALLAAAPAGLPRHVDCESPAGLGDRIALFASEGYRPVRTFALMRRDLSRPIDDPPELANLAVTMWRPDLDEATRLAHNDAFRDHWGSEPIGPERWQYYIAREPAFAPGTSWLALDGATVAGYTLCTIHSDPSKGRVGWLGTIGVRRAYRGRGIARSLILRSLASLAAANAASAGLDVDAQNPTGATRLYRSLGFVTSEESVIYSKEIHDATAAA